jgi:UMF1 family MFS transporter
MGLSDIDLIFPRHDWFERRRTFLRFAAAPCMDEDQIDFVSSRRLRLGYLGGGILLAVNILMIMVIWKDSESGAASLVFDGRHLVGDLTLPLLRRGPDPPANTRHRPGVNPFVVSFRRFGQTLHELRKYSELFKFLIAFWLYNDGIGTVIKMATIYGAEIWHWDDRPASARCC